MRLVQTSARGENSMDVESFGLLESVSTVLHGDIALPPLTWFFCIDWWRAAALSIYQRQMNHHSILVQPPPNLNLFFSFLSTSPCPRMLIKPDHCSGFVATYIQHSDHLSSPPIPPHWFFLNPSGVVRPLWRFDSFQPPEFSFTDVFWPIPWSSSHDSKSVGGGRGEGTAM